MLSHCKSLSRLLLIVCTVLLTACVTLQTANESDVRALTVLYTNDEHGWMEGVTPAQSAASLYGLWQAQEAFDPQGPFLVLSGGDNWTGPAVSTMVAGESMVEVMNRMHYAASAVGNHEFDFGLDTLRQRVAQAAFPYLSANTAWKHNGQVPTDLGIAPYTVRDVNGIRVGIIGLTTTSTPRTTNPVNVAALDFTPYSLAIRESLPALQAAEVDLVFVIAHVCLAPLRELASELVALEIHLIGGGHCNELAAEKIQDTVLLGGGSRLASYARARFEYDAVRKQVLKVDYSVHENLQGTPDPDIETVVQKWQSVVDAGMSMVIGFNAVEVDRRDPILEQAIVDSWLIADTTADVAISNAGGVRAALPAGDITVGTIVGLLPFDNTIIATTLSGAELKDVLAAGARSLVAGLTRVEEEWIESDTGEIIAANKQYRVLVNSFMYAGGDNFEGIAAYDPDGFDTGINYRQPFLDWIAAQQSSQVNPLQLQPVRQR